MISLGLAADLGSIGSTDVNISRGGGVDSNRGLDGDANDCLGTGVGAGWGGSDWGLSLDILDSWELDDNSHLSVLGQGDSDVDDKFLDVEGDLIGAGVVCDRLQ